MTLVITVDVETWIPPSPTIKSPSPINWENDVICPLQEMIDILNSYGQKMVIFLETVEMGWLEENNPDVYNKICDILHKTSNEVGLHTHPEWSVIDFISPDNIVLGPIHHECYSNFEQMLKNGSDLIRTITSKRPISYRSGGYRITSRRTRDWSRMYYNLVQLGIEVDSSVSPELVRASEYVDFRGFPAEPYYPSIQDMRVEGTQRKIIEFPISYNHNHRFDLHARGVDDFLSNNISVCVAHTKGRQFKFIEEVLSKVKTTTFREILCDYDGVDK